MMEMRRLWAIAILVALPAYADDLKIGYIDIWKVIEKSEAGKEAKRMLEEETKKKRMQIEALRNEIQKMENELAKKGPLLTMEQKLKKQGEIQQKKENLMQFLNEAQTELQKKDYQLTQKILSEIKDIIKKIAQKEGFKLIYEASQGGILYAEGAVDLTKKILNEYNRAWRKKR